MVRSYRTTAFVIVATVAMSLGSVALGAASDKTDTTNKRASARSSSPTPRWVAINLKSNRPVTNEDAKRMIERLRVAFGDGEWQLLDGQADEAQRRGRFGKRAGRVFNAIGDAADVYNGAQWGRELFEMADRSRYGLLDADSYSPAWLKDTVAMGWWYGMTGGGIVQVVEDGVRAVITGDAADEAKAIYEITRSMEVLIDTLLPMGGGTVRELFVSAGLSLLDGDDGRPFRDGSENTGGQREVTSGGVSISDGAHTMNRRWRGGARRSSGSSQQAEDNEDGNNEHRSRPQMQAPSDTSRAREGRDRSTRRSNQSNQSPPTETPEEPKKVEKKREGPDSTGGGDSGDSSSEPRDGNQATPWDSWDTTDSMITVGRFLPPDDQTGRRRGRNARSDIGALRIPKGARDRRGSLQQLQDLRTKGQSVFPGGTGPDDSEEPRVPGRDGRRPNGASAGSDDLGDDLPYGSRGLGGESVKPFAPDWWQRNGTRGLPPK